LTAGYYTAMRAAGRAAGTIRLHRHYLARLAAACPVPQRVTTADLRELLARDGWAPETRKSARSVYRRFFRWMHGSGLIGYDPAAALEPIRVPPAEPRPAPEIVVFEAMTQPDPRIQLMVMLAAFGGLRCGEIARVRGDHLDGDVLAVVGKGGRRRAVPIVHPVLLERLRRLDGFAFPGRTQGHVSAGHVSKLLSRALPGGWTGHTLRHRMATVAYAGTRDLLAVGAVLGHSRPETTQRYVRMPDDALRAAVAAAVA
jgi:integrase/recombinase XerC